MADDNLLKGSPLRYNEGTQSTFIREVNRTLVNPLMNETEERINGLFDEFAAALITFAMLSSRSRKILNEIEKKYGLIFRRAAEKIGKAYVSDTRSYSVSGVKRNIKMLSFGRITAFKENKGNVEAISNTADNGVLLLLLGMESFYLAKVKKQVEQAVLAKNKKGVKEYLQSQRGITHRRVENDSRDFYRQVYNAFNREYLVDNRIEKWVWVHTNRAEEQNKYHQNGLNGLTFEFGTNPPVIDQRSGTVGYPGDWYGCQCIMLPVRQF